MSWSLVGKNILVTGGTKGIGSAVVRELCELGASVVTCARYVGTKQFKLNKLN